MWKQMSDDPHLCVPAEQDEWMCVCGQAGVSQGTAVVGLLGRPPTHLSVQECPTETTAIHAYWAENNIYV